MEGFRKEMFKNKEITIVDYSRCPKEKGKILELLNYAGQEARKAPKNSLLLLVNTTNITFDMEILNAFKEDQKKSGSHVKKNAIVGIKGLLKAGYNFVIGLTNQNAKAFESENEAKEWLASDNK